MRFFIDLGDVKLYKYWLLVIAPVLFSPLLPFVSGRRIKRRFYSFCEYNNRRAEIFFRSGKLICLNRDNRAKQKRVCSIVFCRDVLFKKVIVETTTRSLFPKFITCKRLNGQNLQGKIRDSVRSNILNMQI